MKIQLMIELHNRVALPTYAHKHTHLHVYAQKTSYANKGSKASVHLYVFEKLISYEPKLHSNRRPWDRPPKKVIGDEDYHLPKLLVSKSKMCGSRDKEKR